jgi:LPXTG-motif cell wall-anchored protein
LVDSEGWLWLDVFFTANQPLTQAGVACADAGRPVYEGPEFDPNTGHNTSFEVFHSDQYEVASTRYDGAFSSGPTDETLAILRNDGVALLITSEALDGCADPTVFVVGTGGIDFVSLPEAPGATYSVGVPPTTTTSSTTTTTTTTLATSDSSGPAVTDSSESPADDGPAAASSESSNVPWLVAIGIGIALAIGGLFLLRRPETAIPVSGFEKGTSSASRVMS